MGHHPPRPAARRDGPLAGCWPPECDTLSWESKQRRRYGWLQGKRWWLRKKLHRHNSSFSREGQTHAIYNTAETFTVIFASTNTVSRFSFCVWGSNTIFPVGLRFSEIIKPSSSLKESASVFCRAKCRVCSDLIRRLCVYLWSSPSLSSVSESLLAWCSSMRSTSSLHTSQSSQIFNRCRYPTVSWGNAAPRHRLLSTGTHTSPGGSFCIGIIRLFVNGWQKKTSTGNSSAEWCDCLEKLVNNI